MTGSVSAGAVLRDARRRSGLSQVELAELADTTQSVISVYESGRRQPSLATLASLVEAAGMRLRIDLVPDGERERHHVGTLASRVHSQAEHIRALAAAEGVTVLGLFGSAARGEDRPDSDVDLLIDVPAGVGLFALGRLEAKLRELLDAEIDLVPVAGLKPDVRREVEAELQPL